MLTRKNVLYNERVSNADVALLDCATRLTRLLDTPQDIPFLAPMIIREIYSSFQLGEVQGCRGQCPLPTPPTSLEREPLYYRLLIGEQSEAVRQIATSGSNMQRIAEVIKRLKANFTKPLRVEDLAEQANMSAASFHREYDNNDPWDE